jgi:hypothetical protein
MSTGITLALPGFKLPSGTFQAVGLSYMKSAKGAVVFSAYLDWLILPASQGGMPELLVGSLLRGINFQLEALCQLFYLWP